ncbi:MAG: T9SS type A sorting domain-containing protein [candidate division KSB1 bacterium]|nr:T9SS type A sorting domain-containing protein [candidate division KSB1 bacterium]
MQQDLNAIVNQYAETGAAEHVRHLFKLKQEKAPEIAKNSLPEKFTVYCNYPNPFNPETHISYDVPETEQVVIDIFDIQGRNVSTLFNRTVEPGRHSVIWQGLDAFGNPVASGMYFYRIWYQDHAITRKMLLMR